MSDTRSVTDKNVHGHILYSCMFLEVNTYIQNFPERIYRKLDINFLLTKELFFASHNSRLTRPVLVGYQHFMQCLRAENILRKFKRQIKLTAHSLLSE